MAGIPIGPAANCRSFSVADDGTARAFERIMRWISLTLLWFVAAAIPPSRAADNNRDRVEAAQLFEDGQSMVRAGRYGAAAVTFRTLLYVYPQSSLATQARLALYRAEDLEDQEPKVRSVRFQLAGGPALEDIRAYLEAREVALAVQQPYQPRDVERARLALQDLLASRGQPATVKSAVHIIRHGTGRQSVEVLFTSAKK